MSDPAVPHPRVTRRPLALVVALVALATMIASGDRSPDQADAAEPTALIDPALATQEAVRVSRVFREFDPPPGMLLFPVDPDATNPRAYCHVQRDSFGQPRDGGNRMHEGFDVMVNGGNLVFAVEPGVLTKRYTNTGSAGWGWTLTGDSGVIYKYFHLQEDALNRAEGTRVAMGEVIGYVGDSGTAAKNYHLHFEVRPNNVPIDPFPLLDIPDTCRIL